MKSVSWIVAVCVLLFSTQVFAQGSLTPPGAPGATMKTLDQVEPRTVITNLPYVISEPGSYYLNSNLSSVSGGIHIESSHVSLDFRGFTITGSRSTSFHGVTVGVTWTNMQAIAIKGGMITDFGTGISVRNADNVLIQDMILTRNATRGIDVYPYQGNSRGSRISGCLINDNDEIGIYFEPTDGTCSGNTIEDCTIRGNGGYGIYLFGGNGSCVGNIVQRNNVGDNLDRGIYVYADANLIQDNYVWKQRGTSSYGIYVWGDGNFVVRNTCVGNTTGYTFGPTVTYGPLVTTVGALPTTEAGAHPWANFSR
jgi:hypothetical protein